MLPNSRFPLLIYRGAVPGGGEDAVRERFRANGWLNNWRYPGIYTYHHFHSTTHECLGVASRVDGARAVRQGRHAGPGRGGRRGRDAGGVSHAWSAIPTTSW
jgi:uncharacterized protein YjlB